MHTWKSFLVIFCTTIQDFKTNEEFWFCFSCKVGKMQLQQFVLWPAIGWIIAYTEMSFVRHFQCLDVLSAISLLHPKMVYLSRNRIKKPLLPMTLTVSELGTNLPGHGPGE